MRSHDRVTTFMGTDSCHDFSHGNTLPLMAMPWGTHHWSPANADSDAWFFHYRERSFHGLRLTHQPSPWMADWCWATIMPQAGTRRCRGAARSVDIASRSLHVQPHRFAVTLPTEGIDWEAAPTMHGLAMDVRWRQQGRRRLIIDTARARLQHGDHATRIEVVPQRGEIVVRTAGGGGGRMHPDFALHMVLRCTIAGSGGGIFDHEHEHDGRLVAEGQALGGWLELPPGGDRVQVWVAASFVDVDAARALLDAQVAGRTTAQIATQAGAAWDALLDRLDLPGADERTQRLATTLCYRTLLFPRRIDEPGPDGRPRHRCPDTGAVRSGVRVTDNGFWDTARTVYPWYALFCPDHLPTILEGWLEGARATGWMASWASPCHRSCMTGSYADAVFADALARGIAGFDPREALHYLRRHVDVSVPDDAPYGRIGNESYLKLGYVPVERIAKSVARTLDYAYGDWCLARIASTCGDQTLAASCTARAGNWRHVLCPQTGFFRGRHADGRWQEPFDPITWGDPYVEGSAWQFAWHVPHHPAELVAARGGPVPARAFLQQLFAAPPSYRQGSYGSVIHEMREMAAVDFGQYAHSNQPSHFTLPYFAHCGDAAAFSRTVQRVGRELYQPEPDGFTGDEDNGEMSAWWLCATLGLVPDCPGRDDWLCVQPSVARAVLRIPDQPVIDIQSSPQRGNGPSDMHSGQRLPHRRLRQGGSWQIAADGVS